MANEGQPPNHPLHHVEYNEFGQPIGGENNRLCRFLRSIARNGEHCPLDVPNWHAMSMNKKTEMLDFIKLQFTVPIIAEKWILNFIGHKWRDWKYILKTKYWAHAPSEHLDNERGGRFLPDQWIKLFTHWNSEKAKVTSKRNKYARVGATLTNILGRPPKDLELFSVCHYNLEGNSSADYLSKNPAMQDHTNQLPRGFEDLIGRDDVFTQVMGTDRRRVQIG